MLNLAIEPKTYNYIDNIEKVQIILYMEQE
jgi:hypothetical protein